MIEYIIFISDVQLCSPHKSTKMAKGHFWELFFFAVNNICRD